ELRTLFDTTGSSRRSGVSCKRHDKNCWARSWWSPLGSPAIATLLACFTLSDRTAYRVRVVGIAASQRTHAADDRSGVIHDLVGSSAPKIKRSWNYVRHVASDTIEAARRPPPRKISSARSGSRGFEFRWGRGITD